MLENLASAVVVGLSFGNLWICALLVFSLQAGGRSLALGYILGRASAVIALSTAASLVGSNLAVPNSSLNLMSGVFLLAFAAYLALTRIFDWIPPWRRRGTGKVSACGDCTLCAEDAGMEYRDYRRACRACNPSGLCEAEEPEVEPLTRNVRRLKGRRVENNQAVGLGAGLWIGAARGAVMCGKLAVLLPMLLKSRPLEGALIGTAFAASSSVYPLLGFALGNIALKLLEYKKLIFSLGCGFMAVLGFHYLWKGVFG
ncbi:MAG: hypothetical protein GXP49_03460 [Deltaproteobacteria bacterium]|nr:hypothetical protein [Deltaproteobacteria bacterium]